MDNVKGGKVKGNENEYDIPTAVTFLLAGLGIGSLVTILLTPRPDSRVIGIHRVSPNGDLSPAL
jgi:hypothetical protein